MKLLGSPIKDGRIGCYNYLLEMTIQEYFDISQNVLKNNEYQRRRVKSSSTIYSLLKDDLKQGCIMPPIVLALTEFKSLKEVITIDLLKDKVIILDGLQRSYTIRDIIKEAENNGNLEIVKNYPIRVELYAGINKFGILYRMLTYNTGQTQMSTRHQIEIIYSDYIGEQKDGITFLKEVDNANPHQLGEYKFRDIVDGFTSYLERDYLSLERIDILNSIKSLQELTKEDSKSEIFDAFVICYHSLVTLLNEQAGKWEPNKVLLEIERPFADSVVSIFNKSQALTGFGAAIGKLVDFREYVNISAVDKQIHNAIFEDIEEGLDLLICKMEIVRNNAKKIGNDQRLFFFQFFKGLLSKDGESFMNFKKAVEYAYRQYEREAM